LINLKIKEAGMSKKIENAGFICEQCDMKVLPLSNGSYRNHCPFCLFSKHLDEHPGDRNSFCKGLMEPVYFKHHSKKGYQVVHRCLRCNEVKANKMAEDTVQPDVLKKLLLLQSK
jgi:hypothetical protein